MAAYINGYQCAATVVFESALRGTLSPDLLVFPLAFLWRHHIELFLKEIISLGRQLESEAPGFPEHHRLDRLWDEAKQHIERAGGAPGAELANIEANIIEFVRIDPAADGFRYPLARHSGNRSMPNLPEHVNLRVLHEGMSALSNFLSCVRTEFAARIEYEAQAIADGYDR